MDDLAALARGAADALQGGDLRALGRAIDETWWTRQSCAPLRAEHADLVELVRATGLPATTPGSGGAVVALCRRADEAEATAALSEAGCEWLQLTPP
jgi:hypothetical protein